MNNTNITKKQHFVPQFYLRYFTDQYGILQVLDVKNRRIGSPRSCSGVGYSDYFYAVKTGVQDDVSQQIEQWLQNLENIIAKELPVIIEKITEYKHINNKDRYILSAFMSMLWLRSPGMRFRLNKMEEDIAKKTMRFSTSERVDCYIKETGITMSDEKRKMFIKMIETGSYNINFNNVQHLILMVEKIYRGSKMLRLTESGYRK